MSDRSILRQGCLDRLDRRDFLSLCGRLGAVLGLAPVFTSRIARAVERAARKPPVVWLHLAECTGCTESLVKAMQPSTAELILDTISLDYCETVMAAAGKQAEEVLRDVTRREQGKYIAVMEGAIPTADDGGWLRIGGRTGLDVAREVARGALCVVAVGDCACDGGVVAMEPNPSRAMGVMEATGVDRAKFIQLYGCPVNPEWILATLVHYLLLGKLPELDEFGRPRMIYGQSIHDNCERRGHYDAGRFVTRWGSPEAERGYFLYLMGCKGPVTRSNCPQVRWNDRVSWCIGAGAPCMGCAEPGCFTRVGPFYERLPALELPALTGAEVTANTAGVLVGVATGLGIGGHLVGRIATRRWGKGRPVDPPGLGGAAAESPAPTGREAGRGT